MGKVSFYPESRVSLFYIHRIGPGKITLGKTEVMNGIQQVGLSHPVFTINSHDTLGKIKAPVEIVFKLNKRYGMQIYHQEDAI